MHQWNECYKHYNNNYPTAIVDYKEQRDIVLSEYKRALH